MTVGACVENSFLINCPVGQYESNSACVDCSAGHYNNATAQADCNDECPTGTWSTRAASECTKCNEGTTQLDLSTANAAADTCMTGCEAGYAYDSTSSGCTLCSVGFYSRNVTAASSTSAGCTACDTGYTTSGTGEFLKEQSLIFSGRFDSHVL